MTLSNVLLGIWLILVGLNWLGAIAIGMTFLGFWALITGALMLIELYHPFINRRP